MDRYIKEKWNEIEDYIEDLEDKNIGLEEENKRLQDIIHENEFGE